jgi:hypothetical protein
VLAEPVHESWKHVCEPGVDLDAGIVVAAGRTPVHDRNVDVQLAGATDEPVTGHDGQRRAQDQQGACGVDQLEAARHSPWRHALAEEDDIGLDDARNAPGTRHHPKPVHGLVRQLGIAVRDDL